MDLVSLVFGVLSIFVWPISYAGLLVSFSGLVVGIVVTRRRKSGMAMTGIILSVIGLLVTLVNMKVGILGIILKRYFQY